MCAAGVSAIRSALIKEKATQAPAPTEVETAAEEPELPPR